MRPQVPPAAMRAVVRLGVRPVLAAPLPIGVQRRWLLAATAGAAAAPGVTRDPGLLGARPAEIHTPPGRAGRAVLYLHGGAFTLGTPATHRALCSQLAATTGARVYALDYRRPPEAPYPAAVDDAVEAFDDLRARGIAADELAVAGDSAGGWLALATAIRLRDRGSGAPAGPLGLISPWVDLTVPAGSWDEDDLLSASWLRRSAGMFGATVDLTTADLGGLPPTTLQAGTTEALLPDARALAARLRAAGVDLAYDERPGLWHGAQAQAGSVAIATAAVTAFGEALWRE